MAGVANLKHTDIMKEDDASLLLCTGRVKRNPSFLDLTGRVFSELTVIQESTPKIDSAGRRFTMWKCKCSCGNVRDIQGECLKSGRNKSCGCFRKKATISRNTTHGKYLTPENRTWRQMLNRCKNPNNPSWKNYGGRGIKVCSRWDSFLLFLEDMGLRPSNAHSIDRFPNNDGDYEPGNCRWATAVEQTRNQRTNRIIEVDGESKCIAEWSELSGISQSAIWWRLKAGWSPKNAIFHALNFGHKPPNV